MSAPLGDAVPEFLVPPAPDGACWEWPGGRRLWNGYGRTWKDGGHQLAHRVSYEAFFGPIEVGLVIDHLCRNRACVNPFHLEAVTPQENHARGLAPSRLMGLRTHCDQGHEFSDENTHLAKRKNGSRVRVCRTCKRHWQQRYEKGLTRKMTAQQEAEVVQLLTETRLTQREIAERVGTTQKVVWRRAQDVTRP